MSGQQLQDDYRDQFKGLENMDSSVMTAFKVSTQRQAAAPPSRKDKSDRATVEQALDPRTRMVSNVQPLLHAYQCPVSLLTGGFARTDTLQAAQLRLSE